MPRYYENTIGFPVLVAAAMLLFGACISFVNGASPIGVGALVVLAIGLLLLFGSMTVRVDANRVLVRFGLGLLRKSLPLDEIRSATPVVNPWWYGWGLRMTPRGWLYSASGLLAVEVLQRDGRRYRIGTAEPEALAQVLYARG